VNALCPLLYYSGQEYAQVVKMLGNGRCECFCFDGVTRLGHIRGKMRKKVWITAGDIVLVGKRDFQDEKVDIVHKYSADEARNLKQYGELPETARINETAVDMAMAGDDDDADLGIDFDDMYVFFRAHSGTVLSKFKSMTSRAKRWSPRLGQPVLEIHRNQPSGCVFLHHRVLSSN